MTTTTMKTWGQALDFTWRVKWKRMRSAKTNAINAGHVTAYAGRSLPLARMSKAGWWMEFRAEMEEQKGTDSSHTIFAIEFFWYPPYVGDIFKKHLFLGPFNFILFSQFQLN